MMSMKIGSLLEYHLLRFKDFNGCGRKVESFLGLNNKRKREQGESLFIYLFFIDPWLHNNVIFDLKLGLSPMSFLGQSSYGFES